MGSVRSVYYQWRNVERTLSILPVASYGAYAPSTTSGVLWSVRSIYCQWRCSGRTPPSTPLVGWGACYRAYASRTTPGSTGGIRSQVRLTCSWRYQRRTPQALPGACQRAYAPGVLGRTLRCILHGTLSTPRFALGYDIWSKNNTLISMNTYV